jgi:hypothetical protein
MEILAFVQGRGDTAGTTGGQEFSKGCVFLNKWKLCLKWNWGRFPLSNRCPFSFPGQHLGEKNYMHSPSEFLNSGPLFFKKTVQFLVLGGASQCVLKNIFPVDLGDRSAWVCKWGPKWIRQQEQDCDSVHPHHTGLKKIGWFFWKLSKFDGIGRVQF